MASSPPEVPLPARIGRLHGKRLGLLPGLRYLFACASSSRSQLITREWSPQVRCPLNSWRCLTNLLFAEVAYGGHPASHAVDVTRKAGRCWGRLSAFTNWPCS